VKVNGYIFVQRALNHREGGIGPWHGYEPGSSPPLHSVPIPRAAAAGPIQNRSIHLRRSLPKDNSKPPDMTRAKGYIKHTRRRTFPSFRSIAWLQMPEPFCSWQSALMRASVMFWTDDQMRA
jgi:hypothetical protein